MFEKDEDSELRIERLRKNYESEICLKTTEEKKKNHQILQKPKK